MQWHCVYFEYKIHLTQLALVFLLFGALQAVLVWEA